MMRTTEITSLDERRARLAISVVHVMRQGRATRALRRSRNRWIVNRWLIRVQIAARGGIANREVPQHRIAGRVDRRQLRHADRVEEAMSLAQMVGSDFRLD